MILQKQNVRQGFKRNHLLGEKFLGKTGKGGEKQEKGRSQARM